jgi:HPt (histidine-containing phosphotransfer) domain-containing protein
VIADTEPTVDLEQLSQILGENDPSELFDHLQLFLTSFPELMDKIDAAVAGGDCAAIVAPAHTAKGAAATAAARRLRTVLGHLETAARSGIWSEVWLLVPSIRPEFARVEAFIKARGAAPA